VTYITLHSQRFGEFISFFTSKLSIHPFHFTILNRCRISLEYRVLVIFDTVLPAMNVVSDDSTFHCRGIGSIFPPAGDACFQQKNSIPRCLSIY